jgi:hypothetical protein
LEESVARYLSQVDTADRQEPTEALAAKVTRLAEKLTKLKEEMGKLAVYEKQMLASPDQKISLIDPDSRSARPSSNSVASDTERSLRSDMCTRRTIHVPFSSSARSGVATQDGDLAVCRRKHSNSSRVPQWF